MAAGDDRGAVKEIALPAGTVRYREAGEGKPIVFVHGYLVDGRLWDGVVDRLSDRFRCIAPDWPIGAQQVAMNPDADLSPPGSPRRSPAFLEALDLDDVTIVGNDSGGAMSQVLVTRHPERIGRLVLTNCDTHENFPPGIFKAMPPIAKLPGGMAVLAAPFRIGAVARAAFRPFAKTRIPDELIASWMEPGMHDPAVRRDLQEGDGGDEQALHAGGGREAARLRAADPAHLGAGRPLLPAQVRRATGRQKPATPASSRSRTRRPSCRSTSRSASPSEIAEFAATG